MPAANDRRRGMGNPDLPVDVASVPQSRAAMPAANVRRRGMGNPDLPVDVASAAQSGMPT